MHCWQRQRHVTDSSAEQSLEVGCSDRCRPGPDLFGGKETVGALTPRPREGLGTGSSVTSVAGEGETPPVATHMPPASAGDIWRQMTWGLATGWSGIDRGGFHEQHRVAPKRVFRPLGLCMWEEHWQTFGSVVRHSGPLDRNGREVIGS